MEAAALLTEALLEALPYDAVCLQVYLAYPVAQVVRLEQSEIGCTALDLALGVAVTALAATPRFLLDHRYGHVEWIPFEVLGVPLGGVTRRPCELRDSSDAKQPLRISSCS